MSLLACRNAIRDTLDTEIADVTVTEHGGSINEQEVRRVAVHAPALIVGCLGVPKVTLSGHMIQAEAAWAIFVLTKNAVDKGARDAAALVLVVAVLARVPQQLWSGTASGQARDLAATNLHSTSLEKLGVTLWAIRWRQAVDLDVVTAAAELVAFQRAHGTWTPAEDADVVDTPSTETNTELDQ